MKDQAYLKRCFALAIAMMALLAVAAAPARADHLRGMIISWQPGSSGSHTVQFHVQYAQRWSSPNSSPFNCPNSGRCPEVGASLALASLGTFAFGDGSSLASTPTGTITSINKAEDWYVATFTFTHTYPDCAVRTAYFQSSYRVYSLVLAHDTLEHVEAQVSPCASTGSAVASVPAMQAVPLIESIGFSLSSHIAKADSSDTLSYRLASAAEFSGSSIMFPCTLGGLYSDSGQPPGLSIDSATGRVTWDVNRITAARSTNGNQCFKAPAAGDLWAVQFIVTVTDKNHNLKGTVPVDIILKFVDQIGSPPTLTFTPAGPLTVAVGTPVTFTATGNSANPGAKITLNASGVPVGASATNLNQQLPPPVTSSFTWTPAAADVGSHVVTYTATDENSQQAVKSITIQVTNVPPPPELQITTTALSPATVSQPYSSRLTGAGGAPPYRWSGDLPTGAGLSLNATTGEITGTPNRSGSYTLNIKLSDSQGHQTSKTFTLQINAAPVVQLVPFLREPERATVGTPVKLVAGLRGPSGQQLGVSDLPPGLGLHGEISGNSFDFTSEADGRFSATVTFRTTGNVPVRLRATGDGLDVAGEGIVNVSARFAYAGEPILVDLGHVKAGNQSCKPLPFPRNQEGQVLLRFRLLQSTPARHTLLLKRAGESYPPGSTIPLNANDQIEVCLDSGRWAPSSEARGEPWIALITSGDGGDREITQVQLTWQVEAMSFWERWGSLLLALLVLALIASLVYGYIKPQRFPRDLALTFVPSYDELDQSPQPVRQWRGVGIGFYRDAHAFMHSDFRVSGSSNGSVGKLTARRNGVWVTPTGNAIFREVQPTEWEQISAEGRVARAAVVYRIGETGPFFRLSSSGRQRR